MDLPSDHARLIAAVADELLQVRQGLQAAEGLVGDLARLVPAEDRSRVLIRAQGLDALIQTVEALSGVLSELSAGVQPSDAVEGVRLADLAGRLRPAGGDASSPVAVSGEILLF